MRKHVLSVSAVVVVASLLWIRPTAAQQTLTYVDLVQRMTDLEQLAVRPLPGERCAQWSSWDRASKYDEKTGQYVNWDANGDGGGIIRKEGKQVVMAEMDGPGCIWRIWSARGEKGHVRIFLDGSDQPAVDLPFAEYFTAKSAPFTYPTLSYDLNKLRSSGQNLYFPIPYQKSCRVVADEGWGLYYHFTYTTFPKGTVVPTFGTALPEDAVAALKRVDAFLQNQFGTDPAGPRAGQQSVANNVTLAPGQTATVASLEGPRAITALKVKTSFKDREDQMAGLRRLALQIAWDGQGKPAVWCPLGDFFGTAPGENLYKTLPVGMTKDGYYSFWYMPFGRSAAVQLINEDSVEREVQVEIVHAPLTRPLDSLNYFHTKWHRDVFPLSKDRFPDWVMLRTQGQGRFCGVSLHVWDPRGGWWGEGDEKFFVDGEKFPSTFGTGSEDYFGYAWGHPGLFERAYHAQNMTQNNAGHQCVLRWHIVDNVPFQKSFEACIEKYQGNDRPTLYACTARWYLAPDGVDPFEPVPVAERHGHYVRGPLVVGGFKVVGDPPGNVQTQRLEGHGRNKWKNDDQLWWTGAKPGDKLTVVVPIEKAGKYQVSVRLTKAADYGIVQLSLDGRKAGEPIDLYNNGVIPTDPPVAIGTHDLTAGEHQLTVEIVGANPQAIKGYMFGLDEVLLQSAP
jgi:hypothetical protein